MLAFLTLKDLPPSQYSQWQRLNQRILNATEQMNRLAPSDIHSWCALIRPWRDDVKAALSFIQRLDNPDLLGMEMRLTEMIRGHDAVVRQCIGAGL